MSAAIEVRGLGVQFRRNRRGRRSFKDLFSDASRRSRPGEFWALRDVSLEVPEGSTFALIGENGSGKITLLKCMARILRPEKGRIETRGKISALLELGAGFHP